MKRETADLFSDRAVRLQAVQRELKMVRAGARACRCGRTATKIAGSPEDFTALCDLCHQSAALDRRAARVKAERAAMSRRRT
jgi:hypothetical protein